MYGVVTLCRLVETQQKFQSSVREFLLDYRGCIFPENIPFRVKFVESKRHVNVTRNEAFRQCVTGLRGGDFPPFVLNLRYFLPFILPSAVPPFIFFLFYEHLGSLASTRLHTPSLVLSSSQGIGERPQLRLLDGHSAPLPRWDPAICSCCSLHLFPRLHLSVCYNFHRNNNYVRFNLRKFGAIFS
jgi:hypothetical protein